jgi:hypothetical protein
VGTTSDLAPDRWISLYHVTHQSYLPAIRRQGLLPSHSLGARATIWLTPIDRLHWAIGHVAAYHAWEESEMVVIRVAVPRWTVYAVPHGVYRTNYVIPTDCLGSSGPTCQY